MWQIKKLNKYNKVFNLVAFLAAIAFLLLAIFVPNIKAFFVLAFIFFGFLTIYYSFPKAMIYASFPLSYVGLAQIHQVLVVPAKAIISNQYWEGKHLAYIISPYLIISTIALFLIPFFKNYFKKKINLMGYEKTIIILFGLGFLSSIYGSLISSLSMFSVFSQLTSVVWAWYLAIILKNSHKNEQKKIITTLFLIVSLIIVYESLIVFKQTISQSPVGLAIEATKFAPSFGLGADESGGGFRPFGLQAHPNGLANSQLILAFSAWILFFYLNKKQNETNKKILSLVLSLSAINIILSLSRAAFIAVFFIFLFLFIRHKNQFIKIKSDLKIKINKVSLINKSIFALVLFFLILKFTNRLLNSLYSFSEFGGVSTRIVQYSEALIVLGKSPILGIGDQMFVPTSFQLFPKGVMSYFPENVHNGFLLFAIERGAVGFITYLIFLFLLWQKIRNSSINKQIKSVIYSGLIAGFIMMFFHPERNLISQFTLLVITFVSFSYEKRIYKKD